MEGGAMITRRVVAAGFVIALLLSAPLAGAARADATIQLTGVPEELVFPLKAGRNVVVTATIGGGTPRSVWLARSRDATARLMLKDVGKGNYQINLADPLVSAVARAPGTDYQLRVFAEMADEAVVASISILYGLSDKWLLPPTIYVHAGGERKRIEVPFRCDRMALRRHFEGLDQEDYWMVLSMMERTWGYGSEFAWCSPGKTDAIEAIFGPNSANPVAVAWAGAGKWSFQPGKSAHSLVLELTPEIRQAWTESGMLQIQTGAPGGLLWQLKLKAMPPRLDVPGPERRIKIHQRWHKPLPGSNGYLQVHIEDITGGQVLLSILTAQDEVVVPETSVRQGDRVRFSYGDGDYTLSVVKLVNLIFDEDYGFFMISELPPEEVERVGAELEKIDALIDAIERSDVTFIREGEEYTGKDAAAHIRDKLKLAEPTIHTVEHFIDKVAGISWITRQEYQVKLADGTQVGAKAWLREQAAALEPEEPDE